MQVKINGKQHNLSENLNIKDIIDKFSINEKSVVVELNEIIIKKEKWNSTFLKDQDELELVTFVGGG